MLLIWINIKFANINLLKFFKKVTAIQNYKLYTKKVDKANF